MLAQLVSILVNFLPIFIAIVLHETAHGYAAYKLGDNTAKIAGRLSLNPVKHIDLFGTIIFPAMLFYSGVGFIFGWAKPVPVNFSNLKKTQRDIVIVSSAGIVANLLLAIVSASFLHAEDYLSHPIAQGIFQVFLINMVVYNIVLAVFNLLPIPPLDGSKILFGWINKSWAQKYIHAEHLGLAFILFVAFILPIIGKQFNFDFNLFGIYMIKVSRFFIQLLI